MLTIAFSSDRAPLFASGAVAWDPSSAAKFCCGDRNLCSQGTHTGQLCGPTAPGWDHAYLSLVCWTAVKKSSCLADSTFLEPSRGCRMCVSAREPEVLCDPRLTPDPRCSSPRMVYQPLSHPVMNPHNLGDPEARKKVLPVFPCARAFSNEFPRESLSIHSRERKGGGRREGREGLTEGSQI